MIMETKTIRVAGITLTIQVYHDNATDKVRLILSTPNKAETAQNVQFDQYLDRS